MTVPDGCNRVHHAHQIDCARGEGDEGNQRRGNSPGCNRGEAVSGAQQAVDGEGLGDSFGGNLTRKDGPPNGPITMAAHPAQQVLCAQAQYVKPRATLYECSRTR
jgi:hypothetical protein